MKFSRWQKKTLRMWLNNKNKIKFFDVSGIFFRFSVKCNCMFAMVFHASHTFWAPFFRKPMKYLFQSNLIWTQACRTFRKTSLILMPVHRCPNSNVGVNVWNYFYTYTEQMKMKHVQATIVSIPCVAIHKNCELLIYVQCLSFLWKLLIWSREV